MTRLRDSQVQITGRGMLLGRRILHWPSCQSLCVSFFPVPCSPRCLQSCLGSSPWEPSSSLSTSSCWCVRAACSAHVARAVAFTTIVYKQLVGCTMIATRMINVLPEPCSSASSCWCIAAGLLNRGNAWSPHCGLPIHSHRAPSQLTGCSLTCALILWLCGNVLPLALLSPACMRSTGDVRMFIRVPVYSPARIGSIMGFVVARVHCIHGIPLHCTACTPTMAGCQPLSVLQENSLCSSLLSLRPGFTADLGLPLSCL